MTDLIAELAEVVRLASKATPGPWLYRAKSNSWHKPPPEGSPYSYGGYIFGMGDDEEDGNGWDEQFLVAAVQFMRTHAAEIEAMARDAEFGRAMKIAMNAEYDEAKQMRGKRQQEWVTVYSLLHRLKSAAAHLSDDAMHDSAGEGGK